jgi:hypothetical protein
MIEDVPAPSAAVARRRARRLKLAGIMVLVLGIVGAGLIYWLGKRTQDLSDDPSMLGYDRAADRQTEMLYGRQGLLIDDLTDRLKQPGTQALILLVTSGIISAVCFRFARVLARDLETQGETASPPG